MAAELLDLAQAQPAVVERAEALERLTDASVGSQSARRPETRRRRIEQFVAMLARGETIHPQKRTLAD